VRARVLGRELETEVLWKFEDGRLGCVDVTLEDGYSILRLRLRVDRHPGVVEMMRCSNVAAAAVGVGSAFVWSMGRQR